MHFYKTESESGPDNCQRLAHKMGKNIKKNTKSLCFLINNIFNYKVKENIYNNSGKGKTMCWFVGRV